MSGLLLATPAFSDNCSDVLRYTGHEKSMLTYERYHLQLIKKVAQKTSNANLFIQDFNQEFGLNLSAARSSEAQSLTEEEVRWFSGSERVFAPAVKAWESCIASSNQGFLTSKQLTRDNRVLSIAFKPTGGSNGKIRGFDIPTDVTCRGINEDHHISKVLNETSIQVTGRDAFSLICQRADKASSQEKQVGIVLSQEIVYFPLPEIIDQPSLLGDESNLFSLATLKGCDASQYIEAVNYNREVKIRWEPFAEFSRASGGRVSVAVAVNGSSEGADARTKPQPASMTQRGIIPVEGKFTIKAFEPAIVRVTGGASPQASCTDMITRLEVSRRS